MVLRANNSQLIFINLIYLLINFQATLRHRCYYSRFTGKERKVKEVYEVFQDHNLIFCGETMNHTLFTFRFYYANPYYMGSSRRGMCAFWFIVGCL